MKYINIPKSSDITIDCSYKYNENLSKLLKTIMASNYADSFKLVDFGK